MPVVDLYIANSTNQFLSRKRTNPCRLSVQLPVADIILYRTIATAKQAPQSRRKPAPAAAAAALAAPQTSAGRASTPQRRAASLSGDASDVPSPARARAAALRDSRGGSEGNLISNGNGARGNGNGAAFTAAPTPVEGDAAAAAGPSGRSSSGGSARAGGQDSDSGDDFFEDAEDYEGDWGDEGDGDAVRGGAGGGDDSQASTSAPDAPQVADRLPRWGSGRRGQWLHTGVDYMRRGAAGVLGYMPAVADSRVLRFPSLFFASGSGGGDPQLAGALQKIEKTARDSAALAAADGAPSAGEVELTLELHISSVALELRRSSLSASAGGADALGARVALESVLVALQPGSPGVAVTAQRIEGWDTACDDGVSRRFLCCPAETAPPHERSPALELHVQTKPGGGAAADIALSLKLVRASSPLLCKPS